MRRFDDKQTAKILDFRRQLNRRAEKRRKNKQKAENQTIDIASDVVVIITGRPSNTGKSHII